MQIKSNIQTILPRMALAVVGFCFFLIMLCPTAETVSADDGTAAQSSTSSLGVSLTPAPTMEVQPSTSGLTTATSTSQLNITTTDIEKFSVYLSTTNGSNTLTGRYPSNTQVINSISSASQLSAFSANTWGYSLATSAPTSTTLFSAVPTTNTNPVLADVIPSGNDNFYLSIGTAIDLSLPTDTYKNELTVSVIATPIKIVFEGITTMQQMTSTICSNATVGDTTRLTDSRDGKKYWVAKLADDNCWMTQNLALDLSIDTPLTPSDSDVTSSWTPPVSTYQNTSTTSGDYSSYSWNFGEKVITNPASGNQVSSGKDLDADSSTDGTKVLTDVSSGWTADYQANDSSTAINAISKRYDAHYLIGNFYTYTAATAGSTSVVGNAPDSICPRNWHLPTSTDGEGELYNLLITAYGLSNTANGLQALSPSPIYFIASGFIGGIGRINATGSTGYYWSAERFNEWESYFFHFSASSGYLNFYTSTETSYGLSVRCML